MREIKFRAWDGVDIIYEVSIDNGNWYKTKNGKRSEFYSVKDYPLMQYTGLKDKNGKEIYEEDIVENDFGKGSYVSGKVSGTVIWNEEEAKFDIDSCLLDECLFRGNIEVIGNIYENKKLIFKQGE